MVLLKHREYSTILQRLKIHIDSYLAFVASGNAEKSLIDSLLKLISDYDKILSFTYGINAEEKRKYSGLMDNFNKFKNKIVTITPQKSTTNVKNVNKFKPISLMDAREFYKELINAG